MSPEDVLHEELVSAVDDDLIDTVHAIASEMHKMCGCGGPTCRDDAENTALIVLVHAKRLGFQIQKPRTLSS